MSIFKKANAGEDEWLAEIKSQNTSKTNTTQQTTRPSTSRPTSSSSYYGGYSNANIEPEKLYGDLDLLAGIKNRVRTGITETRNYIDNVDKSISDYGVTDFIEYVNSNYKYDTILLDMEKMLEESEGATERWEKYTDDWVALDEDWANRNADLAFNNGSAEAPGFSSGSYNVPNVDFNTGTVPTYDYSYNYSYDPNNPSPYYMGSTYSSYDPTIYSQTQAGAHWPPYNPDYPPTSGYTSSNILGVPNKYPSGTYGGFSGNYDLGSYGSSTYGIGSIGANYTSSGVLGTPSSLNGSEIGGATAGGSSLELGSKDKNNFGKNGIAKLAGNIMPSLGSKEAKAVMAGGAAAAGVGIAGAAIGGGLLVGGKKKYYIFAPEDFEKLDEDLQKQIIEDLKSARFSNERIEVFKNATFKISASELDAHIKKVEKAYDANADFRKEFKEMYKFDLFDDNDNLIKYMLFIALIIDGSNKTDETNIYNIINPSLEQEEVDFVYSGLIMEEYIYDNDLEEDELESDEDEDVTINDSRNADLVHAAEWLKEIENQ
ncbi:MAG: hypothetical protein IJG68_07010 [Bacilli bacterium]|nr:hypothetical protein [Bacilli bacterium]